MDKYEAAQRDYAFVTAVLQARDRLDPIISGEIERGHCPAGTRECYGGKPGKRKTMLKDAVRIAKDVAFILNRAANEFTDSDPDRVNFPKSFPKPEEKDGGA